MNYYGGEASESARLGDPLQPLDKRDIPAANRLMLATSLLLLLLLTGMRTVLVRWWGGGV
jgi:cobalamin biosynthesis protein CobD/CbiB